jgi:hypothetical protein
LARAMTQGDVFERGSNVLEYWLAHAEGFAVRRRRIGRAYVESVIVDAIDGRVHGVVVRSRLHRRRLLPPHAFVAVDPFARELHLARRPRRSAAARARAKRLVAAGGRRLRPLVRGGARATSGAGQYLLAGGRVAIDWLRPRGVAYARAGWVVARAYLVAAAEAARAAPPRLALSLRVMAGAAARSRDDARIGSRERAGRSAPPARGPQRRPTGRR